MGVEYECSRCGWWVNDVTATELPSSGLCLTCEMIVAIPDPEERRVLSETVRVVRKDGKRG